MTPSTLVPALSRSWAPALSSTPVMRKEKADQVIVRPEGPPRGTDCAPSGGSERSERGGPSSARYEASSGVGGEDAEWHVLGGELVSGIACHECITLRRGLPHLE